MILYHVRLISCDSRNICTPPLNPLPLVRGGAVLAQDKTGVGLCGIYKQLTGHDITHQAIFLAGFLFLWRSVE
ncbi:MAG: hypothetical protein KME30_19215 [Iphinoe sp. HA4291-MV1]|jgi:hypothetical protein|nr:hypothetical protein [Iphinoe sp. HA4291-MV1]